MSYILDALRKADAQRERDPSRGIHAHPTALGAASARSPRAAGLWAAAALVAVVVAGAGWYVTRSTDKGQDEPAVDEAPVATKRPHVARRAPVPGATTPAPDAPPAPAATIEPPAPPMAEVVPPPQPGPSAQVDAPGQMPARPAPPVAAAVPSVPAPATTGLPADAPRVSISGGVYSANPAQRMLVVNGQVLSEGSEAAPGLTIEEIKPRTAVLKFRGARYTVAY